MATYLEVFLYRIILSWLDTHAVGEACKEATAKRLSQRIETRLDQAGMVTKNNGNVKITERT